MNQCTNMITQQAVCVRLDLNVPINAQGTPVNLFKLDALIPTLRLLDRHARAILLLTHVDSPQKAQPSLSTCHLLPALTQAGFNCTFIEQPDAIAQTMAKAHTRWFISENLRFWPGEKASDETFARQLSAGTTVYLNDAFGTVHRNDSSMTKLPLLYAADKRAVGPLIHTELTHLAPLKKDPSRPFVGIMGGAKIQTKVNYLATLAAGITDTLLVCPPLSFALMQAYGIAIGRSLTASLDHDTFAIIRTLVANKKIILPIDYYVQQPSGALCIRTAHEIRDDEKGISIGPETHTLFAHYIARAATIFFNGGMGFLERPETLEATQQLLACLAHSKAYRVIGGGDTVAMAQQLGYSTAANFLSTGGGSLLAYLAHEALPGLDALAVRY
ncbi:MAG: phosphoglycerate kinase [Candidatus Babeliales bacterium]